MTTAHVASYCQDVIMDESLELAGGRARMTATATTITLTSVPATVAAKVSMKDFASARSNEAQNDGCFFCARSS
jgi:hypothetical protein